MRLVKVTNTDRNTVIGDQVELADTSLTRLFGLLGKKHLDIGRGLWIKPSSGVHTFFMSIPIDVIGIDRSGNVVKLWQNLVPWRMTSVSTRLHSVIELPAGRIAACNTQQGDKLMIE
jgi:uncharacterized membrane protein (UPF0127 family)